MAENGKKLSEFPFVELIPFVFYVLAALDVTTPTNVWAQKGLQVVQNIGVTAIPLSVIVGAALAILGFVVFRRLRGWRKIATLVLSIFHATTCAVAVCGGAVFVCLLLSGVLSH